MSGSFESLLSGLMTSRSDGPGDATTLPLDRCFQEMRDLATRFASPCPFKVGDAVTVRDGMDVKGAGMPHVVVEVFDKPIVDQSSEVGSNRFLSSFTLRVAHYHADTMTVHAVDHSVLEPWTETHAAAWAKRQQRPGQKKSLKPGPETALNEVVRLLRSESKRFSDAKITWKKGDLVEILGHEVSRAARPMVFEGKAVGMVETIDKSDDTTRVIYFDDEGDRRLQWFKPVDLKPYAAVEPVRSSE